MPKRELSKCREWERERRERLKTCFDALARLLPTHDTTITPSRLEILQRAAAHIKELQQKNKELLLGDQKCTAIAQRDEVRRLRDRVTKLNCRNEQLVNLLRTAGLKVPKESLIKNSVFNGPPKLWSERLSREKAEILRKKYENEAKTTEDIRKCTSEKRKRKLTPSSKKNSSENTPPRKKRALNQKNNLRKGSKKIRATSGTALVSSSANFASKVANILGPGTLILSNGNVVQVPAPVTTGTLHRIHLVPRVTNIAQNSSNSVILTQNTLKNVSRRVNTITTNTISDKFSVLRPKTIENLKQNLLKPKVAIPALPKKRNIKKSKKEQKSINDNNVIPIISDKTGTKNTEKVSEIKENLNIDSINSKNVTNSKNNSDEKICTSEKDTEKNLDHSKDKGPKNDDTKLSTISKREISNQNSVENIKTDKKSENLTLKIQNNLIESSDAQNIATDKSLLQNNSEIPHSKLNSSENNDTPSKITTKVLEIPKLTQNEPTSNLRSVSSPGTNNNQNVNSSTNTLLEIQPQISQSLENDSQNLQPVPETIQNNAEHHEVIQSDAAHLGSTEDHSELSNDIFASLGGPGDSSGVIGAQHSESMSPTAAFLLAFPLVSTLTGNRISEGPNVLSGGANSVLNTREGNNGGTERNDQNNGENERESTPTTLYNLDNKNNTNRLLQITDSITVDTKNNRSIIHQINPLDNSRSTKNVLQPINDINNLKDNRNDFSRSLDNFNYFRDTLYCPNQGNVTSNSCSNPRENNQQNRSQNRESTVPQNYNLSNDHSNKDALISSVLQVSHACLYEGKQNTNFYNNSYPEMRSNDLQNQNSNYNVTKDNQNYLQTAKENVKSSSKSRSKLQNSRPPVNWMTSPDPRISYTSTDPALPASSSGMTSDYFLPPFSDVYNTYSSSVSTEVHQNNDQNFSWAPTGNRSVLPTLLGDLALGGSSATSVNNVTINSSKCTTVNSNSNNYFNSFDPTSITTSSAPVISNNTNTISQPNHSNSQLPQNAQNSSNIPSNNSQTQITTHGIHNQNSSNKEQSASFLSVSSILVGPQKAHKRNPNNQGHSQSVQNSKKREKNKSRTNNENNSTSGTNLAQIGSNLGQRATNISAGSNLANSTMHLPSNAPNLPYDGQNKKYATGYSAEDLISDSSQNYNNIPTYLSNLGSDSTGQQLYNHRGQNLSQNNNHQSGQNSQNVHNNHSRQNQSYQLNSAHSGHRQQTQQQGAPFGTTYPSLGPQHGEFSALLSAAVVDSYSKTFDSFVHVKPPSIGTNGAHMGHTPTAGFEGYCPSIKNEPGGSHRLHSSGPSDSDRRRHSRRSAPQPSSRDTLAPSGVSSAPTNTPGGFSELSFLSMSGAVSSPILQDDYHASATFLNAPPPIPTPVASSLTNFNLSAIFPEINKGATASASSAATMWPHSKSSAPSNRGQSRYQNQQSINNHSHENLHHRAPLEGSKPSSNYCHPQQAQHDGIYGTGGPSQSFSGILGHHQVQTPGEPRGP